MITKWQINTPDPNAVSELVSRAGLSPAAAAALVCAGIDTPEKAVGFFSENEHDEEDDDAFGGGYSDPFMIRDMEKACDIISEAIDSGELICIYGDYDCDGVTATAALWGYLTDIGGNVVTHINEREQGYGMNQNAVRELKEKGVRLIVTVDNGISAIEEARLCKELEIKLVITDHHQPGEELPEAEAVVDPHRRDCPSLYKDFCGCGLVLKLIAAMEGGDMDRAVEQYSDLAAIATIADVVPLTGENRKIVKHGLHYLENTENPGLKALISHAGLKPPYTSVGAAFGLAPRINAAGRIGSPSNALQLLIEEDEERAEELAVHVCELNTARREYEIKILTDISEQVRKDPTLLDRRAAVFCGNGWHHGVVGIAAARCVEKFGRPVFLMSGESGESEVRGSARSVEGFNIFKALSHCPELLERFGGHSGAGGFSLSRENVTRFDAAIQEYAAQCASEGAAPRPVVRVCGGVTAAELTVDSVEGLNILEPFGERNPRPLFLLTDSVIEDIIPLKNGEHTKLMVSSGGMRFAGLMFGTKTASLPYSKGDVVNMLVSPEINEFGGRKSVSLRISDIRRRGLNQSKLIAAEDTYYSFRRGEDIDSRLIGYITPSREELISVYRTIGRSEYTALGLYGKTGGELNFCKFLICLDIFAESGLIAYDRCADRIAVIPNAPKADTEQTPTMIKLKNYNKQ